MSQHFIIIFVVHDF